jgi:hypothetical protein
LLVLTTTVAVSVDAVIVPSTPTASVHPTPLWINAYGAESTLDGAPIPIGATIEARDPQDILVARFQVEEAGRYGLMPIYGDDPATPEDEGAQPGDTLTLFINGRKAEVLGPDKSIWSLDTSLIHLELTVSTGADQ